MGTHGQTTPPARLLTSASASLTRCPTSRQSLRAVKDFLKRDAGPGSSCGCSPGSTPVSTRSTTRLTRQRAPRRAASAGERRPRPSSKRQRPRAARRPNDPRGRRVRRPHATIRGDRADCSGRHRPAFIDPDLRWPSTCRRCRSTIRRQGIGRYIAGSTPALAPRRAPLAPPSRSQLPPPSGLPVDVARRRPGPVDSIENCVGSWPTGGPHPPPCPGALPAHRSHDPSVLVTVPIGPMPVARVVTLHD